MTKGLGSDAPSWASRRLPGIYLATGLLVIAVFAQATLLPRLRFFGASPNLVLIVLLSWSLLRGPSEAVVYAFFAGLAFDLISGLPLGTTSLALMLVCGLAVFFEGPFFQGHVFLPMTAVAIATPLYAWLTLLILQFRGMPVDWAGTTIRVIIPELLLNVVVITLVYPAMRRMIERVGGRQLGW